MITEIGIKAGEIWKLLDEKGKLELSDILKGVLSEADKALFFMALGWLCREGHVIVAREKSGSYFQLKS